MFIYEYFTTQCQQSVRYVRINVICSESVNNQILYTHNEPAGSKSKERVILLIIYGIEIRNETQLQPIRDR